MQYAGDSGSYYFGGNPYVLDEEYIEARNALNNGDIDAAHGGHYQSAFAAGHVSRPAEEFMAAEAGDFPIFVHEILHQILVAGR